MQRNKANVNDTRRNCVFDGCNTHVAEGNYCSVHVAIVNGNATVVKARTCVINICNGKELRGGIVYFHNGTQWRKGCRYGFCMKAAVADFCAEHKKSTEPNPIQNIFDQYADTLAATIKAQAEEQVRVQTVVENPVNDPGAPANIDSVTYRHKDRDYPVGSIITLDDNTRRKIICKEVNGAKVAKVIVVCNGRNNTCTSEAKRAGKCTSCNNGGKLTGIKLEVADLPDGGSVLCSDGLRRTRRGDQIKTYCIGDNNTCINLRHNDNLCSAHLNGKDAQIKGLKKGDTAIFNGMRYIHDGYQICKLCNGNDDTCMIPAQYEGQCKSHSPHWRCKYENAGIQCTKIRMSNTQHCKIHRGGVVNKREMWRLEVAIMNWLDEQNIKYVHSYYVKSDEHNRSFVYDFYLPEYNIMIEADGAQHFQVVSHWGGEDGLAQRIIIDAQKDEWAINNAYHIIRIHWRDEKCLRNHLLDAINRSVDSEYATIFLSQSYGQRDNAITLQTSADSIAINLSEYSADEPVDEDD